MLKKILSAIIILQILTQSAGAAEFRSIIQPIAVQPLQVSSDILKNENSLSVSNDFSFFNISDNFVNHALAGGQGMSISGNVLAREMLPNPSDWWLTNAYYANYPALITLNGFSGNPSSNNMGLPEIKNQFQVNPDYSSGFMPSAFSGMRYADVMTKSYVYDGWNVIEEITAGQPAKYYAWGLDLSQSQQGAGGVGGLLAKVESSATQQYLFDGNGNIGQLINNAGGALLAQYEYDPYGNSIVATGTQAATNQFRFSTKYIDTEYNLYYYGYRFYAPETGRWLGRDPIGEQGGWNLYGFVFNNPQMYYDDTGLSTSLVDAPTRNIPKVPKNIPKTPLISKIPVVPVISAALLGFELYDAVYEIREEITNGPFREYVTYIFQDKCGITRYVGRTGGDMAPYRLYWRLQADIIADRFVQRRFKRHHIEGLKDLKLYRDKTTVGTAEAYAAIRGREQQLIDFFGGAKSDYADTPLLNQRRGVAKNNIPAGRVYHETSNRVFGEELHPYTGN